MQILNALNLIFSYANKVKYILSYKIYKIILDQQTSSINRKVTLIICHNMYHNSIICSKTSQYNQELPLNCRKTEKHATEMTNA